MSLTTEATFNLTARLSKTADLISAGLGAVPSLLKGVTLSSGVAAGMADVVYAKHHDIVAGSPVSLDLSGSLLNPLGDPAVFVKLRLAYFFATAANLANIEIGGGSTPVPAWVKDVSDIQVLQPGSIRIAYDPTGWSVTNTTADLLKLLSASGTCGLDVILIGTSA